MRSRFAAFATGDAEYLWRTLHPDHEDRSRPKDEVLRALKNATRTLKYTRLRIIDAKDTRVLFLASVFEKGRDRSFVELSSFVHDGTGWRYLDGECRVAISSGDLAALTVQSFLGTGASSH
jgi:SEC-C motif-containing protein